MTTKQYTVRQLRWPLIGTLLLTGAIIAVGALKLSSNTLSPSAGNQSSAMTNIIGPARSENPTKVCYTRSSSVYLHDLTSGQDKLVLEKTIASRLPSGTESYVNYHPSLSPKGDAIAFNFPSESDDKNLEIRLLDLKSGETHKLPKLANIDSSDPEWSPDGSKIAFKLFKPGVIFHVAILDLASGNWEDISTAPEFSQGTGVWLDGWTSENKSIVCHNSRYVYKLGVDGSVVYKLPIESLGDGVSASSSTRFAFTADGKYLLFDSSDPEGAILIYNIVAQKITRVSPSNISAIEPRWLPGDDELLFTCSENDAKPKNYAICKIRADGTGLTKLIKDGRFASYTTR